MKKFLVVLTMVLAISSLAIADTISGGQFNSVVTTGAPPIPGQGTSGVQGNPYWNDASRDGTNLNIGYVLSGLNAGATLNTNFLGGIPSANGNYLSQTAAPNTAPASFNFVREAASVTITALYSNSAFNTNALGNKSIGIYDASCITQACAIGSEVVLANSIPNNFNSQVSGQTNSVVNPAYATYGFYVNTCDTLGCYTAFTNSAFNTVGGETAHQHFALFQSATNSRTYYIGVEDGRAADGVEVNGDYNDVVFRVSTSSAVPEPATLSIVGLGLLGLGFLRRHRK